MVKDLNHVYPSPLSFLKKKNVRSFRKSTNIPAWHLYPVSASATVWQ